jgi:hypothetical protein
MKPRDYTLATISERYNFEAYEKESQHLRNNQIQFKNCKPRCE